MKIGILTYHRSLNYGAVLQAVALRHVLSNKLGCCTTFVNYWPQYHADMYKVESWGEIIRHPRTIKRLIGNRRWKKMRAKAYDPFFKVYIDPYLSRMDEKYDVVLYGSDQIWRKQLLTGTYDTVYFGDKNIQSDYKVAYAASIKDIPSNYIDNAFFMNAMDNFDMISVRESTLKSYIEGLGKSAKLVLDPTLLLSENEWEMIIPKQKVIESDYLLFYNMQPEYIKKETVRQLAHINKLDFVMLTAGGFLYINNNFIGVCGPQKFLNLIRFSSFVITSSFHGLAFTINHHIPFYAFTKYAPDRLRSILENLNLGKRFVDLEVETPVIDELIDFKNVDTLMNMMRESSYEFLTSLPNIKR